MKNSLYSKSIIKSDYVKIKGTVSLNYFNKEDKTDCSTDEEIDNYNEKFGK